MTLLSLFNQKTCDETAARGLTDMPKINKNVSTLLKLFFSVALGRLLCLFSSAGSRYFNNG